MAYDTTFGVTKEQRNLFCLQLYIATTKYSEFSLVIQSKEARACNWALRVFFRHLVGETILSFNQCIVSDQELAMYSPIRSMIDFLPCLQNSTHHFGKYHMLKRLDKASTKISSAKEKSIIRILFSMLSDFLTTLNL